MTTPRDLDEVLGRLPDEIRLKIIIDQALTEAEWWEVAKVIGRLAGEHEVGRWLS